MTLSENITIELGECVSCILKIKTGKDEQSIRKAVRNLMTRNELAWDKEKQEWRFK